MLAVVDQVFGGIPNFRFIKSVSLFSVVYAGISHCQIVAKSWRFWNMDLSFLFSAVYKAGGIVLLNRLTKYEEHGI